MLQLSDPSLQVSQAVLSQLPSPSPIGTSVEGKQLLDFFELEPRRLRSPDETQAASVLIGITPDSVVARGRPQ
jgi:hypothetical protein